MGKVKIKRWAKLMQFHKALFIGLGELGLTVTKYVMKRGFDIYGYDFSIKAMQYAKKPTALNVPASHGGNAANNSA
jgi:6-phosphogluconate dehydrogenase (decarboxylating)